MKGPIHVIAFDQLTSGMLVVSEAYIQRESRYIEQLLSAIGGTLVPEAVA